MSDERRQRRRGIVRQACDLCRIRKIRCDAGVPSFGRARSGQHDTCQACEDSGIQCEFNMPVKRRGPQTSHSQRSLTVSTPNARSGDLAPDTDSVSPNQFELPDLPHLNSERPQLLEFHHRYPQPQEASEQGHITDSICPRQLFNEIIYDFLDIIYPTVPLVHRPTFIADLKNERDRFDPSFLDLLVAMCATVVAIVASRFHHYCSSATPLRFQTRAEMVSFCFEMIHVSRKADYFDEPTHTKWATSYLLSLSYYHVGFAESSILMRIAEHVQIARILRFHDLETYKGINCIEVQLKKKAFWLCFFFYVHQLLDPSLYGLYGVATYKSADFYGLSAEAFLPVEVDDEHITTNCICPQPSDVSSITIGFNVNCRIYWDSVVPPSVIPGLTICTSEAEKKLLSLKARLQRVKYALEDDGHPKLGQWSVARRGDDSDVLESQWESMRANVHIGHLWLQSVLFENIVNLTPSMSANQSHFNVLVHSQMLWNEREDICRRLLNILYNISQVNMEPNGTALVRKIRSVAATLLDCPFEQQGDIARRASTYMQTFTSVLARLDSNNTAAMGRQSWAELDQHSRRGISEFATVDSDGT